MCVQRFVHKVADPAYRLWVEFGRGGEWLNLRLVPVCGENHAPYSLAWNGGRFARGIDLHRAAERVPSEIEALCEWLEAGRP